MKRILSIVLILMMVFSATAFAVTVPSDVEGQQYEEAVKVLMEAGVITGDVDGLFHPSDNLTRAQVCKMIVATINPSDAELKGTATQSVAQSGFSDMAGAKWAEDYINYAVANGIVKGYPDGTFKPSGNVTMVELAAMLVRASGVKDSEVTGAWPQNYVDKVDELGFFHGLGVVNENGTYDPDMKAAKWMAAWAIYNAKPTIEAYAKQTANQPQGTDKDKAEGIPDVSAMVYQSGSFDSNITTFDGKTLAKDVKLYTYGLKKNYSKDMEFSKKAYDYREDTVYKYKNVTTPAWYKLEGGMITEMVLPMDTGFSGKVYCIITDTATTLNGRGEGVTSFETLTAGREITWLAKNDLNKSNYSAVDAANGVIYELTTRHGEVTNIAKIGDPEKQNAEFVEITASWKDIKDYEDYIIQIAIDETTTYAYEIRETAAVYAWDTDKNEYSVEKASRINGYDQVRMYQITDEDGVVADIVVVK